MEKINIRNMYIDLLNKIKGVEGVDQEYVDNLIEVVDQEITALDSDINAILSVIPEEASATNQLITADDIPAHVNSDWNATSGPAEILNKPTIPAAQVNSDWNAVSGVAQILNKPSLATVATSGSYTDLSNTPTIPAAQVNSDWNAVSGVAQILNKPTLATVATSGSYTDLSDKPTIPSYYPVQWVEDSVSGWPTNPNQYGYYEVTLYFVKSIDAKNFQPLITWNPQRGLVSDYNLVEYATFPDSENCYQVTLGCKIKPSNTFGIYVHGVSYT